MESKIKDPGAFDFYPERFWYAVEGWKESEICRYWRLLGQQWMRDGLPDDRKELDDIARGKITDRVFDKFPLWADGKRRNNKLEIERQKQRERIAKAKEKSKKMLEARYKQNGKHCLEHTTSSPQVVLKDNLPPTTHDPPHNNNILTRASEKPPTVDEVLSYAKGNAAGVLRTDVCLAWMDDRGSTGWKLKGREGYTYEIEDWRADLRKFHRIWLTNEADEKARRPGKIGAPEPSDPSKPRAVKPF